jgi:hypothetical protein
MALNADILGIVQGNLLCLKWYGLSRKSKEILLKGKYPTFFLIKLLPYQKKLTFSFSSLTACDLIEIFVKSVIHNNIDMVRCILYNYKSKIMDCIYKELLYSLFTKRKKMALFLFDNMPRIAEPYIKSIFQCAVMFENISIVKLMLVDISLVAIIPHNLVYFAINSGNVKLANLLISSKIDFNIGPALEFAAKNNMVKTVELLLKEQTRAEKITNEWNRNIWNFDVRYLGTNDKIIRLILSSEQVNVCVNDRLGYDKAIKGPYTWLTL